MIYSLNDLTENEVHRVIEMAWEDRTPFDVIKSQFGLSEQEVRNLMKLKLKMSSYIRWRNRVEGNNLKHSKKTITNYCDSNQVDKESSQTIKSQKDEKYINGGYSIAVKN